MNVHVLADGSQPHLPQPTLDSPLVLHNPTAENIKYGRPDASDEQVEAAARAANAHAFIEALPEQYDTKVGGNWGGRSTQASALYRWHYGCA